MRLLMWGAAAGLGLAVASGVSAERYLVSVTAGGDGDSHTSNDDPDAFAEFVRQDVGQERYVASANANGGSLYASASRVDPLPFAAISTTAGASIEETIHFTELPPNPSDGAASASGGVGFSHGEEPVPGTIHIDIDPPLAHTYTGSMTTLPVPEPGAPLLAAAGGAVLAAARRRRS